MPAPTARKDLTLAGPGSMMRGAGSGPRSADCAITRGAAHHGEADARTVISEKAYLVLLALVAGERVFELFLSQRNACRAFARGAVEVKQRHYALMVTFHALFLVSCAAESLLWQRNFSPVIAWVAFGASILAQALRYAAVWTLGDRWNTKIIVQPGEQPVVTGLYRWIRHPNYVAIVLEMVAIPMIRGAWITALVFSVGNLPLLAVRISVEERALGDTYAKAFGSRPRFVPKLPHQRKDPRSRSRPCR